MNITHNLLSLSRNESNVTEKQFCVI